MRALDVVVVAALAGAAFGLGLGLRANVSGLVLALYGVIAGVALAVLWRARRTQRRTEAERRRG